MENSDTLTLIRMVDSREEQAGIADYCSSEFDLLASTRDAEHLCAQVLADLTVQMNVELTLDREVQDAYFWCEARFLVPDQPYSAEVSLLFSSWGNFVSVDCLKETVNSERIVSAIKSRVEGSAFVWLNPDVLKSAEYDGVLLSSAVNTNYWRKKTWWDRYFSYA